MPGQLLGKSQLFTAENNRQEEYSVSCLFGALAEEADLKFKDQVGRF